MSKLFIKLALCASVLALCSHVPVYAMDDGEMDVEVNSHSSHQVLPVREVTGIAIYPTTDTEMNKKYSAINEVFTSNPNPILSMTIQGAFVHDGVFQLARTQLPHSFYNLHINDRHGLVKSTTKAFFCLNYSGLQSAHLYLPELTEIGPFFMRGNGKDIEEIKIEAPKLTNIKSELFQGLTGTTIKILPKTAPIFRASLEGRFSEMGEQNGFVLLQLK